MGDRRLKVLLVEDSAPVRRAICEQLRELEDVEISATADGATQARRAVSRTRPDAIVLDLMLAEGSGLDVLRSAEWQEYRPPTVVFSNDCSDTVRTTCKRLGAHAVLDKATEFHLLPAFLRDLLP